MATIKISMRVEAPGLPAEGSTFTVTEDRVPDGDQQGTLNWIDRVTKILAAQVKETVVAGGPAGAGQESNH